MAERKKETGGSKQTKKTESKAASQTKEKTGARAGAGKAGAKKPAAKKPPAKKPAAKAEETAATKTAAGSAKGKETGAKKPAARKPKRTQAAAKKDAAGSTRERPVVNARARYVRIAPRKARLVADQVRGMAIDDAQTLLRFSPRSAARDIAKLIDSAAANAETNHDLVADELLIKDIHVDEGPTLRRYRPRALGRATPINKRTSHIHVALTPED